MSNDPVPQEEPDERVPGWVALLMLVCICLGTVMIVAGIIFGFGS